MRRELSIGIDVGGTNTAFGFVDREGRMYAEGSIPTCGYGDVEAYIDQLCTAIRETYSVDGDEIRGIGIGAPNCNYHTGNIVNAANLPWKGIIPLTHLIEKRFPGIPVFATNDANAATIGEMIYGGAKGMRDFVMITLGTGVGSGFVSNGKLIYGNNGLAGELGHIIIKENGRTCGCGRRGCLETYCSASGIVRTAIELMAEENSASILSEIPYNALTSQAIYEAALKGDKTAIEAFRRTGEILGKALANTILITGPEAIFVMGGPSKAGELLLAPAREAMEEHIFANFKGSVRLTTSEVKGNVAIYGAAALVWYKTS